MKNADFQNLLQGIREAGSYLRGNKKAACRVDHIDPELVAANLPALLACSSLSPPNTRRRS
jgi:hypothetical protein